ncbi:hypothetical protein VC83_07364 [Pseudogymnoascus destructans]|uniref:Uncharacterized protein n=1 Tax=Pseudogymnoascus destructans TaxID=655981 RepID=A0A177A1N4_9PEZI|nr:uncharacterized protein VC83_07364 [Pseudogymnoascus destructans]OAF56185.1 hypothetical protein VC83_07364 [Pseudogymnoascus destructans]
MSTSAFYLQGPALSSPRRHRGIYWCSEEANGENSEEDSGEEPEEDSDKDDSDEDSEDNSDGEDYDKGDGRQEKRPVGKVSKSEESTSCYKVVNNEQDDQDILVFEIFFN